jgi:hypothetical protein
MIYRVPNWGDTAEQPPPLYKMTGKKLKLLLQPGAAGTRPTSGKDHSSPVRWDPVRPKKTPGNIFGL